MNEISINVPAIDTNLLTRVETITEQLTVAEAEAVRALRERYAPLAKHNGYIHIWALTTYTNSGGTCRNEDGYLERDGKRVRGFIAVDGWVRQRVGEWDYVYAGYRLILTEYADWIELVRDGSHSQIQGAPIYWGCGKCGDSDETGLKVSGHIRTMTDAQVSAEYKLNSILADLSKSLAKLGETLPARYSRLQQRAEVARQLLAGLGAAGKGA